MKLKLSIFYGHQMVLNKASKRAIRLMFWDVSEIRCQSNNVNNEYIYPALCPVRKLSVQLSDVLG